MDQSGNRLIAIDKTLKKATKTDLVYFEPSPDYCYPDPATGSLGTAGRVCNATSMGTDGCDIMCCGRGYNTRRVLKRYKCECKFHWCCYVKCKECSEWVDEHTCKGYGENERGGRHGGRRPNRIQNRQKNKIEKYQMLNTINRN